MGTQGAGKKRIFYGLLPNPLGHSPWFALIYEREKIAPHFLFVENCTFNGRNEFTLGPTSKTIKFPLLMVIFCPELANIKGPIKDGILIQQKKLNHGKRPYFLRIF